MKRVHALVRRNAKVFLKYALVGVTGTVLDVGLFALLIITTPLGDSISGRIVAATISFILAVVNNYTWNRRWTFADKKSNVRQQFSKFFLVSCGGWFLNVAFLTLFTWVLIEMFAFGDVSGSTLAKILASGVVLSYNFVANKIWTFKV